MSIRSNVEKTVKIHEIGHGLENVEFEATRDYKVRVSGIHASARRGETSKIPYWIAKILEERGYGHMTLPDMITALKQALSKERIGGTKEFQALEPLFYVKLGASLRSLQGRDFEKAHDMLLELFRMRSTKLVTKASSMSLSADINSKLTVEERKFYNTIYNTCSDFESQITNVVSDDDNDNGKVSKSNVVNVSSNDDDDDNNNDNNDNNDNDASNASIYSDPDTDGIVKQ